MIELVHTTVVAAVGSIGTGVLVVVLALVGGRLAGRAVPGPGPGARGVALRRPLRRITGLGTGLGVGAVAATTDVWLLGADRGQSAVWFVVADALCGGLICLTIAGAPRRLRGAPGSRAAHSRRVTLGDLVPKPLLRGVRTVVVLAMLALVATVVVDVRVERLTPVASPRWVLGFLLDPPVLMATVALLTWAAFEVLGRVIAARPTTARDAADLAAQGLARREALTDLAWTSAVTGALAVLFALPLVLVWPGSPLVASAAGVFRDGVTVLAAVAVVAVVLRPVVVAHRMSAVQAAATGVLS